MDMRKRILTKICSSPPYQWVVRKIGIAMLRRAAKAPEVQERIKALSPLLRPIPSSDSKLTLST